MSDGVGAKVSGVPDVRQALQGLAPKLRVRALRLALAAGARIVQKAVRAKVPVLNLGNAWSADAYRRGWRKPGTVRKAVSVRTSKSARRAGNVGVFVNVRPAKGGARGAKNYRDPFYWRWLDKGWTPASRATGGRGKAGAKVRRELNKSGAAKARPGAFFMRAGAAALGAALAEFTRRIEPVIAKLNRPKAPAP